MGTEQDMQGEIQYEEEEAYMGEGEAVVSEEQKAGQQEGYMVMEEAYEQNQGLEEKPSRKTMSNDQSEARRSFADGVSVGLGIGCIATFIVMWISLFFSPQLPSSATYEAMLSVFIYPLIYLLSVGLVALTAGFVREYYARK